MLSSILVVVFQMQRTQQASYNSDSDISVKVKQLKQTYVDQTQTLRSYYSFKQFDVLQ